MSRGDDHKDEEKRKAIWGGSKEVYILASHSTPTPRSPQIPRPNEQGNEKKGLNPDLVQHGVQPQRRDLGTEKKLLTVSSPDGHGPPLSARVHGHGRLVGVAFQTEIGPSRLASRNCLQGLEPCLIPNRKTEIIIMHLDS